MRSYLLKHASNVAELTLEKFDKYNIDQHILNMLEINAQNKELSEIFFNREVNLIKEEQQEKNYKRRYELAYVLLMFNYFHNQFVFSFLSKIGTEKAKNVLKFLSSKKYFSGLDERAKSLEEYKKNKIGQHHYDEFEYYKMDLESNEMNEYLQPKRKIKMGYY